MVSKVTISYNEDGTATERITAGVRLQNIQQASDFDDCLAPPTRSGNLPGVEEGGVIMIEEQEERSHQQLLSHTNHYAEKRHFPNLDYNNDEDSPWEEDDEKEDHDDDERTNQSSNNDNKQQQDLDTMIYERFVHQSIKREEVEEENEASTQAPFHSSSLQQTQYGQNGYGTHDLGANEDKKKKSPDKRIQQDLYDSSKNSHHTTNSNLVPFSISASSRQQRWFKKRTTQSEGKRQQDESQQYELSARDMRNITTNLEHASSTRTPAHTKQHSMNIMYSPSSQQQHHHRNGTGSNLFIGNSSYYDALRQDEEYGRHVIQQNNYANPNSYYTPPASTKGQNENCDIYHCHNESLRGYNQDNFTAQPSTDDAVDHPQHSSNRHMITYLKNLQQQNRSAAPGMILQQPATHLNHIDDILSHHKENNKYSSSPSRRRYIDDKKAGKEPGRVQHSSFSEEEERAKLQKRVVTSFLVNDHNHEQQVARIIQKNILQANYLSEKSSSAAVLQNDDTYTNNQATAISSLLMLSCNPGQSNNDSQNNENSNTSYSAVIMAESSSSRKNNNSNEIIYNDKKCNGEKSAQENGSIYGQNENIVHLMNYNHASKTRSNNMAIVEKLNENNDNDKDRSSADMTKSTDSGGPIKKRKRNTINENCINKNCIEWNSDEAARLDQIKNIIDQYRAKKLKNAALKNDVTTMYRPISENHLAAMLGHGNQFGLNQFPIPTKLNVSQDTLLIGACLSGPKNSKWTQIEAKRNERMRQQQKLLHENVDPDEEKNKDGTSNKSGTIDEFENNENVSKEDQKDEQKKSSCEQENPYGTFPVGDMAYMYNCQNRIPGSTPTTTSKSNSERAVVDFMNRNRPKFRCKKCLKRYIQGGVLLDLKANQNEEYMDKMLDAKLFQAPEGYRNLEKKHIKAILSQGKHFGLSYPIPTKLDALSPKIAG